MNKEEKAQQIAGENEQPGEGPNDYDVVCPEPAIFPLGDRKYKVYPLPIKKQRLLVRMSKLEPGENDEENEERLDELTNIICEILGEKDKKFIEDNFTPIDHTRLNVCLTDVNNRGLEGLFSQIKKKLARSVPSVTS